MTRLASALLAAIVSVAVIAACAPVADVEAPPGDGPLVAFYGDSYTLGTGASEPSRRWSSIVCAERGWREFNPSVNGLGFVNNRFAYGEGDVPEAIIEQDPDILIVTMGLNDNFSFDARARDIRRQIDHDLERFDEGLPDARIVVVEPFWYTDERSESVDTIIGWVRDGAERIDADFVPGASRWLEGHPEWMAADGIHPDDEGYARLAERMSEALDELGL
ncbi:lysophospholipase L1-like esterase [Diaminobutyricimonas aerilata]|uniref:Lysophospholipase L1-like esterase n=1 Tax=Diaminobutyricimonas aerilata TaxID=1162967 RepID=A0A2M9CGR9_9MICO|nr:SGNH/GDSL hydrolase family protein [Diaminobutyricimonas aerilata]PJJ71111.1 lysophospholipase L1-like esterase [Diaminobutyricimonas aerilata]